MMKFLRAAPLRHKQVWLVMLTVCVALMLSCLAFGSYEVATYSRSVASELDLAAHLLSANSAAALKTRSPEAAHEAFAALKNHAMIVAVGIYAADGKPFAWNHRTDPTFQLPPVQPESLSSQGGHRVFFHPIVDRGQVVGTLYLEADMAELSSHLRQYLLISVSVLLASLLAAFLISRHLQRLIAEPILALAQAARTVAQNKNYTLRVPKMAQDELGGLIDDFNAMLEQIQSWEVALQQARGQLEQRVQERTRELQAEVAERHRAERMLRHQFQRLHLLNQITQAIARRADLNSIFQVMLNHLEEHLPVDFGGVYTLDPGADKLSVAALGPKSARLAEAEPALRVGEMVEVTATLIDSALGTEAVELNGGEPEDLRSLTASLQKVGLHSRLLVPLVVEGRLLGALLIGRFTNEGFSAGDQEFLSMAAEQVALAAHQAKLHGELQKAYNELRSTQKAILQQERLRALGQMASGIAHDINNALAPVIGFADLLAETEKDISEEGRRYLEHIKTAGQDIGRTVERMRDFYRQRQQNEEVFSLSLNTVVQEAVDLSRPRWRDIPQENGRTIELETDLAPGLPSVVGCESEIRQALMNLILNAVDAMPAGGLLTLRTRMVTSQRRSSPKAADMVVVEVIDNGVGMNDETQRRCLEPFFSTKGRRGTGLGLAMVYGVMERHEGRIEIQSAPKQGTTVRLLFPARATSPAIAEAVREEAAAVTPLRVLCIDDEPLVLEVLRRMLKSMGHEVETASGGETGIELVRRNAADGSAFDAVITDLGMPGMDGRLVARTIKAEAPHTPVILLTGWGIFLKDTEGNLDDIDVLLSKPPSMKDLRRSLNLIAQKRQA